MYTRKHVLGGVASVDPSSMLQCVTGPQAEAAQAFWGAAVHVRLEDGSAASPWGH